MITVTIPAMKTKSYAAANHTLTLQKLRMLQIRGVKGEAVVNYREPLTTKEMRYPRLSRRVENMTN